MIRVVVSMRGDSAQGYDEPRDALSHDWGRLLQRWGAFPVPVMTVVEDPGAFLDALGADRVLLSNGESLGVGARGEETGEPSLRDDFERRLLLAALERGIPVLGVCRGLALINWVLGGRVCRNVTEALNEDHCHGGEHDIEILETGGRVKVNSYHRQGVLREQLADDLVAWAVSPKGLIEAVRHRAAPVVAVQWHPERPGGCDSLNRKVLKEWLEGLG